MIKHILDILRNPYLITPVVAWLLAQTTKVITHAIVYKEWDLKRFFGDGGMPSAHTATIASLAAFTGFSRGFASFEFAVCVIITIIICRDAVGVRYETGKQAQVLNELRQMVETNETSDIMLKKFVGHTPLQVIMGAIVGIIAAAIMNFIL